MEKRRIILTAFGLSCAISTAGCTSKPQESFPAGNSSKIEEEKNVGEEENGEDPPLKEEINGSLEEGQETKETQGEGVEVVYTEELRDEKGEDGVSLLSVKEIFPSITIKGKEEAAKKINDYYVKEKEEFQTHVNMALSMAKDGYTYAKEEGMAEEGWNGYMIERSYSTAYSNGKLISILSGNYEYLGGAHPNYGTTADVFELSTGERLTLDKIFKNKEAAISHMEQHIIGQIKERGEENFFPEYEKSIKTILEGGFWYFSDRGIEIISNPYMLAPYAAGEIEFTIPYEELTELKEEYKE
ncbi:DUF3298/DUF4163 domain-containing protein [bacterium 1XD42-8]|jgi:hypothetical protein|nr:DUF3298 and DUF4163 domain-containing protein [Lachnospiraceae bacterium]RKJ50822.1 DUF3298/DUF4163 domain-containing protein [bacterium 1XD42-8]